MTRDAGGGTRDAGTGAARRADSTSTSPALRCPRCGAWLSARASTALAAQRRAEGEGRAVAVCDDAPFCGCCGLLVATPIGDVANATRER